MTESSSAPLADLAIYGSPVSPFVRKVAAVCLEKGAEFAIEPVDVFNPPEWFVDISPARLIPVLRDRSIATQGIKGTIADSSAIAAYLEKKHAEPTLYPAEAYAHGRALFVEEYADNALARATGLGIFRPIFFAVTQGKEPDLETARTSWSEKLPPVFDYLERSLDGAQYFVGDSLTIADITVACTLMQATLVAQTPLDKWPSLANHIDRMSERPSIAGPFAKANGFIRKALPDRFDLT